MEQQTPMPAFQDKQNQINALASIVPQIMNAIGGGDQRTAQLLEQQRVNNQANMEKMKVRNFMRSVMSPSTGEITPELIMEQAQLFGVDPVKAMETMMSFDKHRQAKARQASDAQALNIGRRLMSGELTREGVLKNTEYPDTVAMGAINMLPEPPKPDYHVVKVPGQGGKPITKRFTGSQLDKGVETYEKPAAGEGGMSKDQAKKEYVQIQGKIDAAKSGGGLDQAVYALLTGEKGEIPDRSKYINTLERYAADIKKRHGLTFDDEEKSAERPPSNQDTKMIERLQKKYPGKSKEEIMIAYEAWKKKNGK